ncbi:hypothetical protein [Actinophytocola oryzae]|nr:hypothetical protein [Actinophytocola oryzae]
MTGTVPLSRAAPVAAQTGLRRPVPSMSDAADATSPLPPGKDLTP